MVEYVEVEIGGEKSLGTFDKYNIYSGDWQNNIFGNTM